MLYWRLMTQRWVWFVKKVMKFPVLSTSCVEHVAFKGVWAKFSKGIWCQIASEAIDA